MTADRLIASAGTARRLQALAAIGWPSAELGRRMGRRPERSRTLLGRWRDPRQRIHTTTAAQIVALYDTLRDTPGPSPHTRNLASRAGWAPPAAWDGRDIDDPHALPRLDIPRDPTPDEVLIARVIAGRAPLWHLPVQHRRSALHQLRARGMTVGEIADHVQAAVHTVERHLHHPAPDAGTARREAVS